MKRVDWYVSDLVRDNIRDSIRWQTNDEAWNQASDGEVSLAQQFELNICDEICDELEEQEQ